MFVLDKVCTASFDVDAQKTFTPQCPDELPVPQGDMIAEELNRQANLARLRLGSKDAHSPEAIWVVDEDHPMMSPLAGDNVDVYWPLHAVPGSEGFALISGLPHPKDYDYFVWKGIEPDMHPYGACYHDHAEHLSTGVIEYLLANKIETIVIGGLALDYCVKITALQLAHAKFRVVLNLAATRGIASDTSKQAISEMQTAGIHVISSVTELANDY
mgnify:CR=1 FL=1